MLYQPSTGKFKDTFIYWHEGKFYLYSMYTHDKNDLSNVGYRNVWLAISDDGVRWESKGAVIADAPFPVWAMGVHRAGHKFILNHGSFGSGNKQNVIKLWESTDLIEWVYMGEELDLKPDERWYHPDSRLDCMDVFSESVDGQVKYYGYATGPGGFVSSDDGIHWVAEPQTRMDWGSINPPPALEEEGLLEIGGCRKIGDKYYLVGGWFNYMGYSGYGVYTLVADSPRGPFKPDAAAYRLSGNSLRWVSMWARFCRAGDELLICSYLYDGYSYENGGTWLPPMKRASVDAHGHLRLHYWAGNDGLKGAAFAWEQGLYRIAYPVPDNEANLVHHNPHNRLELQTGFEVNSLARTGVPTVIAVLEQAFDMDGGAVIEGFLEVSCRDRRFVAPGIGFCLEESDAEGTVILLDSFGTTRIGLGHWHRDFEFVCEDETRPGSATVAGIEPHRSHSFRLLIRKNMFELYLNDRLVQTYNTTHAADQEGRTPRRIGFLVQNGSGVFRDVKMWRMNLE